MSKFWSINLLFSNINYIAAEIIKKIQIWKVQGENISQLCFSRG
jgi:hypothetical protein